MKNLCYFILLILFVGFSTQNTLFAQVARPSMDPTKRSLNPAVSNLRKSSLASYKLANLSGELNSVSGSTKTKVFDISANDSELFFVFKGETWAAEYFSHYTGFDLKGENGASDQTSVENDSQVNLAFQAKKGTEIGAYQRIIDTNSSSSAEFNEIETHQGLGFTTKLTDWGYLALAGGSVEKQETDVQVGNKWNELFFGYGVRSDLDKSEKGFRFGLEFSIQYSTQAVQDATATKAGHQHPLTDTNQYLIEFGYNDLFLTYDLSRTKETVNYEESGASVEKEDISNTTEISLGYAPIEGINFVYSTITSQKDSKTTGDSSSSEFETELSGQRLSVAYAF